MLKRILGPTQIQLISLGGIIGSGYFIGAGSILADSGFSSIPAFMLGGFIAWLVAMAMGELCVSMPREGSFVSQSRELLGRSWAAGVGWSYWFNWCAYIPSEMIAGGLILHELFPQVSTISWVTCFAVLITVVNLANIRHFGRIESSLALLKIIALSVFSIIAFYVFFQHSGEIPIPSAPPRLSESPSAFLITMVLVLVNFQGTELIALSSAETKDPETNIPKAARNVALRTIALYVLPLALLIAIFPWSEANEDRSVFADALLQNGFIKTALLFQCVIATAAFSCANSGLYGAVRSLYGLGKEGLAPAWVTKLNSQGVPALATWLTVGVCWAFLPFYRLFEGSAFYTWLLSVSGFTGAICWISITLCQIRMRRQLSSRAMQGKLPYQPSYKMPGFPYLSFLSIALQLSCLVFVAFHPTLRSSLVLGIPAFVIPVIVCYLRDRIGRKPKRNPRSIARYYYDELV